MQTQFSFFCFKMRWVCFFISFAVPTKLTIIFWFIWAVTFDAFGTLNSTRKCSVFPFPTIFTLWNAGVHVSSSYSDDIPSYIETFINQTLGFAPALDVPNINLNDQHIWLQWDFDDLQFWSKYNIVKNLILFDDVLNIARSEIVLKIIVREIWNAYYFKIGLGLWEPRNFHV